MIDYKRLWIDTIVLADTDIAKTSGVQWNQMGRLGIDTTLLLKSFKLILQKPYYYI